MLQAVWDEDAKPAKTPIGTDGHVDLNKGGKSVDQKAYRSMIGSLLYLCASRPDIMLSVCMCARFQSDPKECHLVAVKRILRYLVATPCFGIWYPKGSTFDLIGYADSDYAGCKTLFMASRPDIMLSLCMCARYQSDPRECHLVVVKRILRYLVSTPWFGIWYPKGSTFDLIGYLDSDYAGCKVDRKSKSGTCQFLGRSLVS